MNKQCLVRANQLRVLTANQQHIIVDGASFEISAGEVLAIIGPNGAGKSTLLKALANDVIFGGQLEFLGFSDEQSARARQIAVLPQSSSLNFPFKVCDVVALGRIPHASGAAADAQIVTEALALMDIQYLAQRRYTDLSGGEKQRVQLARVFAQIWRAQDALPPHGHRLLLLDEPTNALDLGHQRDLMRAVKAFRDAGVGIAMVMHDINLAARYADRVLALLCSEVVAYGSVNEVITKDNMQRLFSTELDVIINPTTNTPYVVHD